MKQKISHPWDVSIQEAKEIQYLLQKKVSVIPLKIKIRTIAGIDTAFSKKNRMCFTAIVLLSYPEMETLEELYIVEATQFPYIPGFLSFREGPSIISALDRIKIQPDLLMFDGQGIAHPRNLGIASHIGVLFDIPSIGCAKSKLCGTYSKVGKTKGDFTFLLTKNGKSIGSVLRTRNSVKPVFVSPGHRIDIKSSKRIVLSTSIKYRLPEPTRQADKLSKKAKHLLSVVV